MKIFALENRGFFVVLGGFLIHLSIGNFYISGKNRSNITEYMINNSYSGNAVNNRSSVWILGSMTFAHGAAFSLGGYLEKRIGTRLTILIGGLWMSLNIILTYWTIRTYLSVVIISYGIFTGLGVGLVYGPAFNCACSWFPNRKGLVIGLVISGYGISAMIFESILDGIFKNLRQPDLLPTGFIFISVITACLIVIGSLLLRKKEEKRMDSSKDQMENEIFITYPILKSCVRSQEINPYQMLLEFDFWILWLIFLFNATCDMIITSFYHEFGKTMGITNIHLIYEIISIFNCIGRIFWGYLIDKRPFKMVMVIITFTTAIFIGTLNLIKMLRYTKVIPYVYGGWLCILNFLISGNFSVLPAVCANIFGMKNIVINYGMIFTASTFSGTIVIVANVYLASPTNFTILFAVGCALSLIATGLTLLFRGRSLIMHEI